MKKWKCAVMVCLMAAFLWAVPGKAGIKEKILIDPGHQGSWVDMSDQEAVAPGASEMKAKATTGTEGRFSGVPEYELTLRIGLALEQELTKRGYEVVMTRKDHDTAISNQERAKMAEEEQADISVRIHANGSEDPSISGALTMAPSPENPYVGVLSKESERLSSCILDAYCNKTGLKNQGILFTDHMTGINFSTVPVTILEMGYMSNEEDDLYMTEEANEREMVQGIADGIDDYFGYTDPVDLTELNDTLEKSLAESKASGEKWSVEVVDLNSGSCLDINGKTAFQSASVIKVFIMGAVYERAVYAEECRKEQIFMKEQYDGELKDLLSHMITISDNEAANELVERLGEGDFEKGAAVVNEFCREHGFEETHLGRRFLEESPKEENLTSASDCAEFLTAVYRGTLINQEASEKMLKLLKAQSRTGKIPAGIPESIETANKTGEIAAGYGLGTMENDIALVLHEKTPYVLCVFSNEIEENQKAQEKIREISEEVYKALIERKINL